MAIKLKLKGILVDLTQTETIATSYAVAPVSDISRRSGARSITFNLPLTANNKRAIENSQEINDTTTLPYDLIEAYLTVDGLDMGVRFAELVEVSDKIRLRLYGGNVDLFAAIKDININELTSTAYGHFFNREAIARSIANDSGYFYPISNFVIGPSAFEPSIATNDYNVQYTYPALFVKTIFNEILAHAGYTATGDFLDSEEFINLYIQTTTKGYTDTQVWTTPDIEPRGALPGNVFNLAPGDNIHFSLLSSIPDTYLLPGSTIKLYKTTAPTAEFITLKLDDAPPFSPQGWPIADAFAFTPLNWSVIDGAGGLTINAARQISGFTGGSTYTLEFIDRTVITRSDDPENQYALIRWRYLINSVTWLSFATGGIGKRELPLSLFGYDIYVNPIEGLPKLSAGKFLKALAQMYGLIYQVDAANKVVDVRQFKEIVANIPSAVDWTDKSDYAEEGTIRYKYGKYAQKNNYIYKEQEGLDKPEGTDGVVVVDNQNLPDEVDLVSVPFGVTQITIAFPFNLWIARFAIWQEPGTADQEEQEIKAPRILSRVKITGGSAIDLVDSFGTTTVTDYATGYFIDNINSRPYNLGFEDGLLTRHNSELITVIQSMKTLDELVRLTPSDINKLDFFKPVYLGRYRAYFYISEVNQFKYTSVESTEVELFKLTI